jgi:MoCo/4Fe-4S cofactor protein with predicted Tat translocation signal
VDFVPATNGLLLFELIESFEAIFNKRTVYMRAFTAYFAFDFARAVSDPRFRAIAHQELPKGMAADDFSKLSRREFFAKAVDVLRKPIIL